MGTNQTTKETRRASYDAVIPKVKERSRLILETLGSRSMTVSEITDELVKAGRIPYYNRNYVAQTFRTQRHGRGGNLRAQALHTLHSYRSSMAQEGGRT